MTFSQSIESICAATPWHAVEHLFGSIGSDYIFELVLNDNAPTIDFSTCFLREQMTTLLEARQKGFFYGDSSLEKKLHHILNFCRLWTLADSDLYSKIHHIWFEFDHCQLHRSMPIPCIFFSTKPPSGSDQSESGKDQNFTMDWVCDPALTTLRPVMVTELQKENIMHCFRSLPPGGQVFQVGVLFSRNTGAVRLCTSMAAAQYSQYLERINWPGSLEHITPLFQTLAHYGDGLFLDLDVGNQVSSKAGIEVFFSKDSDLPPRLRPLLDLLVELELCTVPNAAMVCQWLENANGREPFGKRRSMQRGLSHLKIVLDAHQNAEAKVYLSLSGDSTGAC